MTAIEQDSPSPLDVGHAIFDALPIGVLMTDRGGRVVAANQEWSDLSGLEVADSLGDGWWSALDAADHPRLRAGLQRALKAGVDVTGDYELRAEPRRWLRWHLRRRDDGNGTALVMVVADVTADRDREAQLSHRATHDGLTGLLSADEFLAFVHRALRRRERHSGQVVVVFVDLDDFKAVNDRGGHQVGDRVLAAAARRLREAVRPEDVVARVGGDEFAVLCGDVVDTADAVTLADRIQAALAVPFEVDGRVWHLGATVGVAVADRTESPEAVVGAADRAMYEAKRTQQRGTAHGSHRVPMADPGEGSSDASSPSLDGVDSSWVADAVFVMGLKLATTLEMADGPTTTRPEAAIDVLDRLLHDVRATVVDGFGGDGLRPTPSSAGLDAAAQALRYAAKRIDRMATTDLVAGNHALPLLDAAQSAHRALLALDEAQGLLGWADGRCATPAGGDPA